MLENIDNILQDLFRLFRLLGIGALTSLKIFFLTLIFSMPLGLAVAFGRMSKNKLINSIVRFFILVMRGTPLILQIMFIYYAPSFMLPEGMKINIDRFVAAIIAFSLNYSAYEAAAVLGFTKVQTFFKIIVPQVIKRILPSISNEVITLVKDTALVTTLGISELYRAAKNEAARVFSTVPLFVAGLFYLFMNSIVTKIFDKIEKKLSYYR